jgi:hypothetical protein
VTEIPEHIKKRADRARARAAEKPGREYLLDRWQTPMPKERRLGHATFVAPMWLLIIIGFLLAILGGVLTFVDNRIADPEVYCARETAEADEPIRALHMTDGDSDFWMCP